MQPRNFLALGIAWVACGWGGATFAAEVVAALPAPVVQSVGDRRLAELEKETGDRSVDSILEQALAYDERGQWKRAAPLYRQAAAQGVGVADLRLGWFNESGNGAEQDYALAKLHYERAAALGVPEANMRLGLLYLEGWGVARNAQTAVTDMRLAADAGYVPAQQVLSEMYFSGTAVKADLDEAIRWAERAAAGRAAEDQEFAGSIRARASRLPEDIRAAREWFLLSAEQEYATGMLRMAETFLNPGADPASMRLGVRWLELAVESGNPTAAFYLAGMNLFSPLLREAPDHEERAKKLLVLSAQGGEYAAADVLEEVNGSKSLSEAFSYVMKVPVEERYIQRLAVQPPTAWESEHHLVRPRPIKMVTPIYPSVMVLTKTEAEVLVEFVIDTKGRVRDAKCVRSPHRAFAGPAVAAVMAWRFLPATKNGRAINTRVQIPVRFNIGGVPLRNRNSSADATPAGS